MSSTVSCRRAAHSVSVSSRMPAQIFATPTGWTMKSSPDWRRWSAWCSQAKTNASITRAAVDLAGDLVGVLLDDREQVGEQLALGRREVGGRLGRAPRARGPCGRPAGGRTVGHGDVRLPVPVRDGRGGVGRRGLLVLVSHVIAPPSVAQAGAVDRRSARGAGGRAPEQPARYAAAADGALRGAPARARDPARRGGRARPRAARRRRGTRPSARARCDPAARGTATASGARVELDQAELGQHAQEPAGERPGSRLRPGAAQQRGEVLAAERGRCGRRRRGRRRRRGGSPSRPAARGRGR